MIWWSIFCYWRPMRRKRRRGGRADGGASGFLSFMAPLFLIAIIFYFLLVRPQKREREKQDQLLKGLKKNDRVVTIGGVVGTIVNIEPESKVVTLKVDDSTRMVFLRSAIQGPYADGEGRAVAQGKQDLMAIRVDLAI